MFRNGIASDERQSLVILSEAKDLYWHGKSFASLRMTRE